MGRLTTVAVLALLACAAPASAAEAPLNLPSAVPPALSALEAKADALQITSARTSVSVSLNLGGAEKKLRKLAQVLDTSAEGVETTSPPAAALKMTLFGAHIRLRYVDGHVYLYSTALARRDGGRPWIELAHGPLSRMFGSIGKADLTAESSGSRRFAKLFTLVNEGTAIHELPPTTLYGQPVTGFGEELDEHAGTETSDAGGALGAFSASSGSAPHVSEPKPTLSIYLAASGAPVRVQIRAGTAGAGATMSLDFPAIDFPLTIPAPPAAHVISEAKLTKRAGAHHAVSLALGGSKQ